MAIDHEGQVGKKKPLIRSANDKRPDTPDGSTGSCYDTMLRSRTVQESDRCSHEIELDKKRDIA
jgi:hypothetical protein